MKLMFLIMAIMIGTPSFGGDYVSPYTQPTFPKIDESKAVFYKNKIYLYGGISNGSPNQTIWQFDENKNTWDRVMYEVLPGQKIKDFDLVVWDDFLTLIGGKLTDSLERVKSNEKVFLTDDFKSFEEYKTLDLSQSYSKYNKWIYTGKSWWLLSGNNDLTKYLIYEGLTKYLGRLTIETIPINERKNNISFTDAELKGRYKSALYRDNLYIWGPTIALRDRISDFASAMYRDLSVPLNKIFEKLDDKNWKTYSLGNIFPLEFNERLVIFNVEHFSAGKSKSDYAISLQSSDGEIWTQSRPESNSQKSNYNMVREKPVIISTGNRVYLISGEQNGKLLSDTYFSEDLFNWNLALDVGIAKSSIFQNTLRESKSFTNKISRKEVKVLQTLLNEIYKEMPTQLAIDGFYGPKTDALVKKLWNDFYPFVVDEKSKVVNETFWDMLVFYAEYGSYDLEQLYEEF